jgi:DNA-binding beta-propeller fold protein YncE
MADDDDIPPPGGRQPPREGDGERSEGGLWRDEEPPESDLPATGAHNILGGDDDEDPDEEEGEGRIPSFEEYRRQREEGSAPGGPGSDEPDELGSDAPDSDELDVPDSDEPDSDEPDEPGGGERESGEPEDPDDDEETLDSRDFEGQGRGLDDSEGSGDTLDGGEALEGLSLPEGDDAPPISSYEEELARQASDLFPTSYEHTADEIQRRRAAAHRRHRRNGQIRLLILVVVVALIVFGVVQGLSGSGKPTPPPHKGPTTPTSTVTEKGHLAIAAETSVLPGNLLIADSGSRQLLVVSPTGQVVWSYHPQSFSNVLFTPNYAFFNPSGSAIAITDESHGRVEVLGIAHRTALFTYGHYDATGSGVNYLDAPSAALVYANGQVAVSDIHNCRVAVITPPHHLVVAQLGETAKCTHSPPQRFDEPASAFPLRGGGTVVTELHDDWVDLLNAKGKLTSALQVPRFKLAYGVNETPAGDLIAVDHTHPGAVEIFSKSGAVLWSYAPKHGAGILFDPSLAEVLPDGDVIVSDDYHDRVIVIDPKSNKIVWQYGHTDRPGGGPGYLDVPAGFDLVHPNSLLDRIAAAAPPR